MASKIYSILIVLTLFLGVGCSNVAKSSVKGGAKTIVKKSIKSAPKSRIDKKYNKFRSLGVSEFVIDKIATLDKRTKAQLLKDLRKNKNLIEKINDKPSRITSYSQLSTTHKRTDVEWLDWIADMEYKSSKSINEGKLQNNYRIKNLRITEDNGGRISIQDGDVVCAEYYHGVFYAKSGTPANPNNFLNLKPCPNSTYNVDGTKIYKIDHLGRPKTVREKNIKIKIAQGKTRNNDLQAIARDEKGGLIGERDGRIRALDDGGHLFADIFRGICEMINIVPMSRSVNRSQFKIVEAFIKQSIESGKHVSYICDVIYEGANMRPTKFNIKVIADGEAKVFSILNI